MDFNQWISINQLMNSCDFFFVQHLLGLVKGPLFDPFSLELEGYSL